MGEGGSSLALASLGEPQVTAKIGGGGWGGVGFYQRPQA